MNPKIVKLLHEGFSINTLENLSNTQINILYEKVKNTKKKETKEETTKNVSVTTYSNASEAKGKTLKNATFNADGTITTTNEGEVTEKSVSKKQRGLMGAAYSVEKGDKKLKDIPKSYRGKVKDVVDSMSKKQVKDFASTKDSEIEKENKNEIKKLEENILRLVDKYIPPHTTKSDLLHAIKKYNK
jgi:hypothetical protein